MEHAQVYTICVHLACIYIHVRLATPMNGSPMRPATHTRPRAASLCARVCTCCVRAPARVCVCDCGPTHPRRNMRARSVGVDRGWLGPQALRSASAFNTNIGAWNTASVSNLYQVCAAFSARRRAIAETPARPVSDICIYIYIYIMYIHIYMYIYTYI